MRGTCAAIRLDLGDTDWDAIGEWLRKSWLAVAPNKLAGPVGVAEEFYADRQPLSNLGHCSPMRTQRSGLNENWRKAQQARISLWIRETVKGWIYFDDKGDARLLTTDEARKLEHEANRLLDHHSEREFTAGAIVALLCILGLISVGAAGYLSGPKALAAAGLAFIFFGAARYEGKRYERDLRSWRSAASERFKHRPIVEANFASHHRRQNLFRYAAMAMSFICMAPLPWLIASASGSPFIYLLIIAGCILTIPLNSWAQRVDTTHRKRKWFDERPM